MLNMNPNLDDMKILYIVLTSTVIASLVTYVINIIIAIMNNHRLKIIENDKRANELTTFRYTQLYEMLLKWDDFTSPINNKPITNVDRYVSDRLVNDYIDDQRRLQIISPLLDDVYMENLSALNDNANSLLNELIKIEKIDMYSKNEKLKAQHQELISQLRKAVVAFDNELMRTIYLQSVELLKKQNH